MLIRFSVYLLLLMTVAAALMANQGRGWKKVQSYYSSTANVRALSVEQLLALANQNNTDAQRELSYRFEDGNGVEKDLKHAFEWQLKAAMAGADDDQARIAWFYEKGLGTEADPFQAAMWYKKSAVQGNKYAQNLLGLLQVNGNGSELNVSAGCLWIEKSAEQGLAEAQHNMGYFYSKNGVCGENLTKSVQFLEKSARQGYSDAAFHLGRMLVLGEGIPANPTDGLVWLEKAQQKQNLKAIGFLGWMYLRDNRGVKQNLDKARDLLQIAAAAKDPYALTGLGWMYAQGRGVPQDVNEAERLFRQAAILGHSEAQYRLAKLLLNTQETGAAKDLIKGYAWLMLAAQQNDQDAKDWLQENPIRQADIEIQVAALVNQWRKGQAL